MMTTVGRGRGNWGTREAPAPLRKPGELTRANSEEEDGILSAINRLDISDKCKCENIELQIKNYCDNREQLWKMTQKLYDSGLNDRTSGEKVVIIWKGLSKLEVNEVKLRSVIMSIAQKEFEEREEVRREDPKRFLNSIALLGGIFHYLTLPTGDPYTVLINPLIEYYQFLLQECSKDVSCREDELELLAWELNQNGNLLKKYGEDSLTNLMLLVRTTLVASQLSEKCHYWLLLMLDLSLHDWNHQSFPSSLKKFYSEKIGKSFNLLTYHPLPSVQEEPKNSTNKVRISPAVDESVDRRREGGASHDGNYHHRDGNFDRNRRNWQQDRGGDQHERKNWQQDRGGDQHERKNWQQDRGGDQHERKNWQQDRGGDQHEKRNWQHDRSGDQHEKRKPAYWGHDDRFDPQDDSNGGYGQQNSFGGRRGGGGGRGGGNWRGRGDGRQRRDFKDGGRWNDQPPRDNSSVPDLPASEESWD